MGYATDATSKALRESLPRGLRAQQRQDHAWQGDLARAKGGQVFGHEHLGQGSPFGAPCTQNAPEPK
eukprot:12891838-Prorocentrum_lima.AAC.1